MRVMLVAPPWLPVPPKSYGGTEEVVDVLARGLVAAGHEVLLWTTGDSTCPVERRFLYEEARGVGADASVEVLHLMHAYAQAGDVDLVHDHTVLGPLYAAPATRVPVVTTNHGPFSDALNQMWKAISTRIPIIAISHFQASTAPTDVRIAAVIHHGIEVERFPFRSRPDDYWLFLGRASAAKGPHRAARVAREAGVRLVIAAKMREPDERRYFDEQVRPLLGEGVEYVGEVGGDQKLRLLAGARGLLNPVLWPEPFGLVMVEALACGTPVLAFPSGSVPEIVRDGITGFLCADEAEMVRRLGEVDSLDRHACRVSVEESFSAERMVADHLALYERVTLREAVAS